MVRIIMDIVIAFQDFPIRPDDIGFCIRELTFEGVIAEMDNCMKETSIPNCYKQFSKVMC